MSSTKTPRHQAALEYAAKGWPVFPCVPGEKAPAVAGAFKSASIDPAQIDKWWGEADYNIGMSPESVGWCAIDTDPPNGEAGWSSLEIEHGFAPETMTVKTPRGGHHRYFKGSLPPTVGKLAPHVDTRGRGSYALLPPSYTADGEYTHVGAAGVASLPDWTAAHEAFRAREKAKAAVDDLDQPQNVSRAVYYLEKIAKPTVQREGGDANGYTTACTVLNLGISPELGAELMFKHWAPRCDPFDDRMEAFIGRKIANAAEYAQNEPGAWAVSTSDDAFGAALDKLDLRPEARAYRFPRYTLAQVRALPLPEWLVQDMIPERSLSLWYGPPESFKSFLALQIGMEVASPQRPVLYIGAEGTRMLEVRASAWLLAHDRPLEDTLTLVPDMPWAQDQGMVGDWADEMLEQGPSPAMVVVDTAAYMLTGLNENDAKDVGLFVAALAYLKKRFKCAILIVHHSGKETARGARGSSALLGAVDTAFEVVRTPDTNLVAVYCRKMKDADKPSEPWCYEGKAFAGSLVFQPVETKEFHAMTHVEDNLSPKAVGEALRRIKAVSPKEVSGHVLASTLLATSGLGPDQLEVAAGRLSKKLAQLAREGGPLEPYRNAHTGEWSTV